MKNIIDAFFEGYPFPKTSSQEVLLTLITQGYVSIFDFPYLSGFRTRVSELQTVYHIQLDRVLDKRCNKFGNTYTYAIHCISKYVKNSIYFRSRENNNNNPSR